MEQLVEGITPSPTGVIYEDVQSQLAQFGAWIPFTDVLIDTHEDENLKQFSIGASEQASLTRERIMNATKGHILLLGLLLIAHIC